MSFSQSTLPTSMPAPTQVLDAAQFLEYVTKTAKLLHETTSHLNLTPDAVKVLSTMQIMLTMFADLNLYKIAGKDHQHLISLADNKILWKEELEKLKLPSSGIIVTDDLEHALHYREEEKRDYISCSMFEADEKQLELLKSMPVSDSTEEYKLTPENEALLGKIKSKIMINALEQAHISLTSPNDTQEKAMLFAQVVTGALVLVIAFQDQANLAANKDEFKALYPFMALTEDLSKNHCTAKNIAKFGAFVINGNLPFDCEVLEDALFADLETKPDFAFLQKLFDHLKIQTVESTRLQPIPNEKFMSIKNFSDVIPQLGPELSKMAKEKEKKANTISQIRIVAIVGTGANNKGSIQFASLTCYTNQLRAVELTTIPNVQELQKLYDEKYQYLNDESRRLCVKYGVKAKAQTSTIFNFFNNNQWAPVAIAAAVGLTAICVSKLSQ